MEMPRPRSWWSRNWIWVVLVSVFGLVLVCGGSCAGIFAFVTQTIKGSDAYKQAVARAEADPQVVAELGQPITTGWWAGGAVQETPTTGTAALVIPLKGPKGSGTLMAEGNRQGASWVFNELKLISGSGQQLDLLPATTDPHTNDVDAALATVAVHSGFSGALDRFKAHCGRYPSTAEGLAALVTKPSADDVQDLWGGPYVPDAAALRDPWGHPYQYASPGARNAERYDLSSWGPDGAAGTADDIHN
jgi:type II secretion system protein G